MPRQTVKAVAPRHGASSIGRIVLECYVCEFCAVVGTIRQATTFFNDHASCDECEPAMNRMAIEIMRSGR